MASITEQTVTLNLSTETLEGLKALRKTAIQLADQIAALEIKTQIGCDSTPQRQPVAYLPMIQSQNSP